MNLQVAWNKLTKVALVQPQGTAIPGGSVNAGTFVHDGATEAIDRNGLGHSHVWYQHVQDLLYKQGQLDMQAVRINTSIVLLERVTLAPKTASKAVGATQQLTATFYPTGATDKAVVWSTSDATKATVSNTGLVTAVAVGSAVITAKSSNGTEDTSKITVTA